MNASAARIMARRVDMEHLLPARGASAMPGTQRTQARNDAGSVVRHARFHAPPQWSCSTSRCYTEAMTRRPPFGALLPVLALTAGTVAASELTDFARCIGKSGATYYTASW